MKKNPGRRERRIQNRRLSSNRYTRNETKNVHHMKSNAGINGSGADTSGTLIDTMTRAFMPWKR